MQLRLAIKDLKIDVYGKLQTTNFKYFKVISTRFRQLLIHASILMQHTVQIVLILKTDYWSQNTIWRLPFALAVCRKRQS